MWNEETSLQAPGLRNEDTEGWGPEKIEEPTYSFPRTMELGETVYQPVLTSQETIPSPQG
jgi:hypothetical protein